MKTVYQSGALLKAQFGATQYAAPSTWYFALSVESADGTFTEPTGSGYARIAIPNTGDSFTHSATEAKASTAIALSFATAESNWGKIRACGLFDAQDGGNLCWVTNLSSEKDVDVGTTITFPAGAITFTES